MGAVNLTSLQRANETYQKDFQLLPYALLIPALQQLRISMLEVDYKDIVIVKERNGGATMPYAAGSFGYKNEISRLMERELTTHMATTVIKDNVTNYRTKRVLFDATKNKVNNQTKQHPLERDIIADQIIITGEDIIDALFHAERNILDKSPMGIMNGYNPIIDSLVVAGEVSEAKGNLVDCGSLATPSSGSDTTAFISLRNWLRSVDDKWKQKEMCLYIPNNVLVNAKDALDNKYANSGKDITFDVMLTKLREDCMLPNLKIISHYCLGTGDRLILTEPGNLDLGMNTFSDADFVQVRSPWEDANEVQFWLQFAVGTRIKKLHKRGFMVSDGTATSNPLSGDYNTSE